MREISAYAYATSSGDKSYVIFCPHNSIHLVECNAKRYSYKIIAPGQRYNFSRKPRCQRAFSLVARSHGAYAYRLRSFYLIFFIRMHARQRRCFTRRIIMRRVRLVGRCMRYVRVVHRDAPRTRIGGRRHYCATAKILVMGVVQ